MLLSKVKQGQLVYFFITKLFFFILETFRKYPAVPTVIKKCKTEFLTDFGLKLPKNSLIFLSIFGVHHDQSNYSNPEHFDPDRFFEDKLEQDRYLPFGYGLRTDIGNVQFPLYYTQYIIS